MPAKNYLDTKAEDVDKVVSDIVGRWKARGGVEQIETLTLSDGAHFNLWINPPRLLLSLLYSFGDDRSDYIVAKLLNLSYAEYEDLLDYMEWGSADELVRKVLGTLKDRRESFLSKGDKPSSPS